MYDLLGRGRRACDDISADELSTAFIETVEPERIRSATIQMHQRRWPLKSLPP